jgi:hypothetical protein
MTRAFTDFLREQSEKTKRMSEANQGAINEWRGAVERLFRQMRAWLADSDPDGIIQIEQKDWEVTEPSLGEYRIPRLDLRALGKWIGIVPKARNTVVAARPPQKSVPERATGRVDITDEVRRYVLYRLPDADQDTCYIDDLRSDPKPLDQQTFEAALMSYLR